jgi:NitT/TauT family transport system permease protein
MSRVAWLRLLAIAVTVGLIEALCRGGAIDDFTMIPPSQMVTGLVRVFTLPDMAHHIVQTLVNVGVTLVLAISVGFVVGAILFMLPRVRRVVDPLLASYYAIPIFVFYPLFIVLFGLNRYPQIAIGFLLSVVAMIINTLNGFDRVSPVLMKTARVLRMGRAATIRRIILPYATLYIFTGLKLAVAYAFIGVIGRRVHPLRRGHGLRDQLRLQQLRQPGHVPADPADHPDLHLHQHVALRLGEALPGAADRTLGGTMGNRPVLRQGMDILILVVAVLACWQLLYQFAGEIALTSPWETALTASEMMVTPSFWPHLEETGLAFLQGYAIAALAGLAIGLLLGVHRLSGEVAEPILVALYSIPKITLYPIILLFFGIGMPAKVAFGAIHGVIPVAIFAMNAMRNIKPVYLRTGRALRLGPWALTRTILLPAAVPEVFTGLRVGFALTLVGTLMGEMFGSQRGLGYILMQAMGVHNMRTIMSVTLILVLFATAVSVLMLRIDRRLHQSTEVSGF